MELYAAVQELCNNNIYLDRNIAFRIQDMLKSNCLIVTMSGTGSYERKKGEMIKRMGLRRK
jgi:hypothetical protein